MGGMWSLDCREISLVKLVNKGGLNDLGLMHSSGGSRGRSGHAVGAVAGAVGGDLVEARVLDAIVGFSVCIGIGVVVGVGRGRGRGYLHGIARGRRRHLDDWRWNWNDTSTH